VSATEAQRSAELARLHTLSLAAKALQVAVVVGQAMVINRLLGPAGRGLVETALSIGVAVGVLQNLGFTDSTVRALSATTDARRRASIIVGSLGARGLIGLLTALALWIGGGYLARRVAAEPAIAPALRLYGLTILLTAVFQTFEAALMGLQRFRGLFVAQIAYTIANALVMVGLVAALRFQGYFVGQAIGFAAGSVLLAWLTWRAVDWRDLGRLRDWLPRDRAAWATILRPLFAVAAVVYVAKILYSQYIGIGAVVLQRFVDVEQVGYFGAGKQVALHLLNLAEAANIVNLSVMSQRYAQGLEAFRADAQRNLRQLLALVGLVGGMALLFARELIWVTAGAAFLPAVDVAAWLLPALVLYSFVHIAAAAVLVPSGSTSAYIVSYALLLGVAAPLVWALVAAGGGIVGAAMGLCGGAAASAVYLLIFVRRRFGIAILDGRMLWVVVALLPAPLLRTAGLGVRLLGGALIALAWTLAVQRGAILDILGLRARLGRRLRKA